MISTRTHLRGATSFFMLVAAGLLPGPVQGEVAVAQVVQEGAPMLEAPQQQDAPAVTVAPAEAPLLKKIEEAKPAEAKPFAEGIASYYGAELAGNRTANGERFNPNAMTAAHRSLPMGTKVRVINKANGKSVVVRINDRGPFAKKRILDVSKGAAEKISMVRSGTARVEIHVIG